MDTPKPKPFETSIDFLYTWLHTFNFPLDWVMEIVMWKDLSLKKKIKVNWLFLGKIPLHMQYLLMQDYFFKNLILITCFSNMDWYNSVCTSCVENCFRCLWFICKTYFYGTSRDVNFILYWLPFNAFKRVKCVSYLAFNQSNAGGLYLCYTPCFDQITSPIWC